MLRWRSYYHESERSRLTRVWYNADIRGFAAAEKQINYLPWKHTRRSKHYAHDLVHAWNNQTQFEVDLIITHLEKYAPKHDHNKTYHDNNS